MPAPAAPARPCAVPPAAGRGHDTRRPAPRPLPALSTAGLMACRRELERAIAFFGRQQPVPPVRAGLHARLDQVLAAQDDRAGAGRA